MIFFRTTAEVKQYINIDINMRFDKLKPSIDDAAERFLKPLLGLAFYNELLAAYKSAAAVPGDLTADQRDILPYLQRALAFYAAFLGVDEWGVSVGDLGIQQQYNQNSQPAPAAKVHRLTMKYLTSGDAAADKLLEFLEATASVSKYGTWFADLEANTAMSGRIVYKTAIASKYIDINDSRRIFLKLKKRIQDIEQTHIRSLICKDQYEEIVLQLQTGSLTSENRKLMDHLGPIIAKKALYLTLPTLPISIEATGIMMYSSNDGVVQKQTSGQQEKQQYMNSLRSADDFGYEGDASRFYSFIHENIDDYPLISTSPCWASQADDGTYRWRPENNPCNKHFSV